MASRPDLQKMFEDLLGTRNVYFQPPSNLEMHYPCIRYCLRTIDTDKANDKPYKLDKSYEVTYIDEDPDNEMAEKLAMLPFCTMVRSYVYDGLNCYVYTIHNN